MAYEKHMQFYFVKCILASVIKSLILHMKQKPSGYICNHLASN